MPWLPYFAIEILESCREEFDALWSTQAHQALIYHSINAGIVHHLTVLKIKPIRHDRWATKISRDNHQETQRRVFIIIIVIGSCDSW